MNAPAPVVSARFVAARRRPVAVVALWVVELAVAWVLAAPWVDSVAAAFGQHPDGDRALWWEPGHQWLTDVYIRYAPSVSGLFRGSIVGLTAWFVVSTLPLGALVAALSDEGKFTFKRAVARGAETFGPLVVVQVLVSVAAAVVVGLVGVVPSMLISGRAEKWSSPHAALFVSALPFFVAAAVVLFLLAVGDLARALVVRHGWGGGRAFVTALRAPRPTFALLGLSIPRCVASAGMIGLASAVAGATSSILLIALAHQAASLARVGLRASVLARALRVSDLAMHQAAASAPR